VSQPSYLERVDPVYPAQARRLRQEGAVVLTLFISAEGRLDRIEVTKSSGHRLLDEAAVAAERKSRFRPATVEGRPVPCQAEVPYRFELE
jgi:protein TonB